MFFIQTRWYTGNLWVIFFSIAFYFVTLFFITSFIALDFNFFEVWLRLMTNKSFWLTLILLVSIVMAKDIYVCGLERNFNFKPQHIIQEVRAVCLLCLLTILLILHPDFCLGREEQRRCGSGAGRQW